MGTANLPCLRGKAFYLALVLIFFFPFAHLFGQNSITVNGTVKDDKGIPLLNVSVLVKGTKLGTTSDGSGKFSIQAPGEQSILVFSTLGYQTQELVVGKQQSIDVVLKTESKTLNEVLVTGYSKQSRRDVTGAVSVINSDVIANTPVTDVGSILQGRAAGVSVDDQGGPGNTAVVRIRGFGSITNNNPLYVVDGVQMQDANNLINPNDIETITVLKDPSITSLNTVIVSISFGLIRLLASCI